MVTAYALCVSLVNVTEDYSLGTEYDPLVDCLPAFTRQDGTPDLGVIYRCARREYGRCVTSTYVDGDGSGDRKVGWYFVKRARYEDTGESYLQGAWVTIVHENPDYDPRRWIH